METTIYLIYRTDRYHSKDNRRLVYIGEDFADSIEQVAEHCDCSKEQAEQLWQTHQSNTNNDREWVIEEHELNQFV